MRTRHSSVSGFSLPELLIVLATLAVLMLLLFELLVCAQDERQPARDIDELENKNVSYFFALPQDWTELEEPARVRLLLTGDRNLEANGAPVEAGLLALPPDADVGWTSEIHNGSGNVALGDGSVHQFTSDRLRRTLRDHGSPQRLVIP